MTSDRGARNCSTGHGAPTKTASRSPAKWTSSPEGTGPERPGSRHAFGPALAAGYWTNHRVYRVASMPGTAAALDSATYLRGVPHPVAR